MYITRQTVASQVGFKINYIDILNLAHNAAKKNGLYTLEYRLE